MKRPAAVPRFFVLCAAGVILFFTLPLLSIFFSVSPGLMRSSLTDHELLTSIGLTFLAGTLATALGAAAGVPAAYLLARSRFRGRRLVEAVVDLPIILPHTAAGVALLMVFGRQGWLGAGAARLGVFFTDNLAGVVVAMLFVSLSFLVNAARDAFARVDVEMERVALVDGATPWQVFWYITLPQAWRGVLSGAMVMWARGISEFGAVVILAYHPKIVPVLVFERFSGFGLAAAQPAAVVLIGVVLVVFSLLRWLAAKSGAGE